MPLVFPEASPASSLKALDHGQFHPGKPEPIKILLLWRTRAVFEGVNNLIGHFVMMSADVVENQVRGGVNFIVVAEDANFRIAQRLLEAMAGDGDHRFSVCGSGYRSCLAIISHGSVIRMRALAGGLQLIELPDTDERNIRDFSSIAFVPSAFEEVTVVKAAIIVDSK